MVDVLSNMYLMPLPGTIRRTALAARLPMSRMEELWVFVDALDEMICLSRTPFQLRLLVLDPFYSSTGVNCSKFIRTGAITNFVWLAPLAHLSMLKQG
mmetsp:Transcript_9869/g.16373  ORF Transcript_9869/g.16373 Transcript_9869/m.16373 type:complete len:98 (-) Transcript_9869:61-354(-)